MIIDHIGIGVRDYQISKAFYQQIFAALDIELITEVNDWAGFGKQGKPEFWLKAQTDTPTPVHIAFAASSRAQVDAFYRAALAAGARDNGAPGVRAIYHPHYYGAFVLDPDGHNIEAVCHQPA